MSGPGRPEPIRPTTPIQPAPVRDWRLDDGAHLDRAFRAAAGDTPEQAARVLSLSRRTGFTPAFVKDNFDVLERESAKETFDARAFSQSSPLVADWLAQDPSRVALMGRDLTRMGMVERQARNIVARFQQGRRQTELLRIGEAALQGTITPAQRERQRALEAQRPEDFGLEGFFEGAPGAAAEQLPILGRTIAAGGVGGLVGGVAGAVVGGAVGKSPASAQVGASFGMRIGAGTAVAYDVAVMEASGAMLDYERLEGLDPETARGAALIAGAISGSLELLSLKQLASVTPGLRDLSRSGVRSLLTNPTTRELLLETARGIGLSAATEGATETLQSLITQGGGTIAAAAESGRLETDLAGVIAEVFGPDAMAQALAEGRAGAQSGLLLASVGGAGSLTQDVVAARRAERQAEAIATLADAGGDAEVTAKAPDEVSAMVTELRQAGLSGFSYDAETWRTFWQSAKDEQGNAIDPAAVAAEVLGDVTAYQTALASGGTFEVPLGNWLTRLARNPTVREWAVQHAKVGPGEMSAAEAATSAESAEKVLESLVEQAVTQKAEAVPVDEAAAKLAARVEQEVRKAGRPVREAKRAGQLWGEVYRTWAATSGTSAEDLAAMFARVRIGDVAAEGEVSLNQSRPITRPELETWLAAEAHRLQAEEPGITPAAIAADLGVPVASVTRYLAAPAPDLTPEAQRALDLRVAFVGTELHQAAFHGSPHVFDKFTTAKMGTGEGAQAYGWGLYFAENQGVAEGYRNTLAKTETLVNGEVLRPSHERFEAVLAIAKYGYENALARVESLVESLYLNEDGRARQRKVAADIRALKGAKIEERKAGALYRVDIPDAVVAKMLDWDKPLKEQAPSVKKALAKVKLKVREGRENPRTLGPYSTHGVANAIAGQWGVTATERDGAWYVDVPADPTTALEAVGGNDSTGQAVYEGLSRALGDSTRATADERASKALLKAGIPGIKFLDAGSRNARPKYRGDMAYVRAAESFKADGKSADEARAGLREAYPSRPDHQKLDDAELDAAVDEAYDIQPVQTRNLVIFDENDVTITHRNGEPVTAAERAQVLEQSGKAETLPATIDIDGTPRPTTNANGHPIALTEQGVRNFWAWFGDSKVVDAEGRPLVVYHGTTGNFDEFDVRRASAESDWGRGVYATNEVEDVSANYAGEGPDLTQRIQLLAERIAGETDRDYNDPEVLAEARERLAVEHGGATMPLYMRMLNPLMVGGGSANETHLTFEMVLDDEGEPTGDERGTLVAFIEALRRIANEYNDGDVESFIDALISEAVNNEDVLASDIQQMSKKDEQFGYFTDDEGNLVAHEVLRRAFEEAGFDGVIDATVDEKFGSSRTTGQQMKGVNYDTVHYVAFEPTQVKSALGNSGAFGSSANILQQSGDAPRGRIRFDAARTQAHIELFEAADASTFFHESAHLFLSLMGQLAASPNATDRIKADYAAALDWLGAKPGEALTVAQEEQFARGFEAYLMEGKAPSLTLRSAFASFANWLTRIYKSIRGLDVELSADIRRIFDRMLATDAAIQEAEESGVREPVFLGSDEVMPAAEAAKYGEAIVRATEAATEALRAEVLSVIAREEKAWFKARRAELEPEVRAEVYAEPAYQARSVFQSGKMPDGTALPEGDPLLGRLSKEGVVQLIGEAGAKALPKPVMYRVEGGVHPDVAATAFGYANGTELLAALMGTQHIEKEIRQRTETRLRQEYGDPLTDGTMPALAVQAIQTAERDRVIQMELEEMRRRDPAAVRGLLRRFGGRIPVTAEVMQQADAMLATRTIRDIRPIEFQRAEVKAAKAAIAAAVKGDWATAAEQKIRERLSLALTRAAIEAHAAIDKAETRFTRYFRPDDVLAKTRDMNLVNAARATLARVGIGRAEKSPEEYLKAVRQYDAETADDLDALIDTSVPPREDSRDLTLAEFRQVDANATGLWEQAKRTQQMVIDGKKMARAQIVDEMGAELETMPDRMKGAGRTKAFTTGDTIRRRLLGAEAALRRVESWVDQLDGGNIHGIFRRYLWTPISEASAAFRVAKRDMTQRYLDIVKRIPADRLTGGPFAAPEINYTFRDRQELLGAMLHTGNLSNKDKLLRGRGWDVSQWDAMERRMFTARILDESDVRFLNEVWALFESVKPEAQRVHKAMLGTYFDEITAVPRETGGGTLTGGYVPAMADTMLNEDAAMRNEKKEQEAVNPSTMFPSVNRGFTKSRVDAYAAPLIMDLRLIRTHIDAVTKFIHLAEPTRDLGRLLLDRRFRGALAAVDPEMGSELAAWAQRAGSQVVETPSRGGGGKTADTIFRWFRSTAGLNMMALNVQNTLQQFTGLSIAAVKVPPTYLRNALWQVVRQPKQMHEAIAARSPYMATRVTASVMDVERRIDQLITNPNAYQQAKAFAREHGYILQSTAQGLVDAVVWQGAFDWATANGLDETMAVRQADAAVRLTQGSFAPEDVSRFETGSPFVRAFTMFYSYFNMQANLLRSEFAQEMRKSGLRKGAGRMLYVYTLGFMVPAVLSQAILEGLAGHADDDDDEGELSDWMAVFFGSQVRTAFALVPGGNILVQAGINQFNDKWYDDRVSVSPAVTTIEQGGRGIGAVYDWWSGEEVQRRDIKDVLTLLSLASGFPFGGLARPLTYLYDVEQGTAEPTGPVDFTRGLVSGRP